MIRRAQVVACAIIALGAVRCSFLLDDDVFTSSSEPDAAADGAASANDATAGDATANDASGGSDARDAASFPDSARVWSGNGHAYEVILVPGKIDWLSAKVAAKGRGGHLATVTSEEENTFIFSIARDVDAGWVDIGGELDGPWLGGEQTPGPVPDAGWKWITGEPFAYAAWATGEPSDDKNTNTDETVLHYKGKPSKAPFWNDVATGELMPAYVVEYE